MKAFHLVLLAYLANSVSSVKFRFDNYTLYKIHLENAEQVQILRNLQDTDLRFDFWSEPVLSAEYVQVMTSPENKLDLQNILITNNINAEISMNNVQE